MGIQLTDYDSIPTLKYDKVHLCSLKIDQPLAETDGTFPIYKLIIVYKIYAIDENGARYYKPKPFRIHIEDYLPLAMSKLAEGDPSMIGALQAIEGALATIITQEGKYGEASVTE